MHLITKPTNMGIFEEKIRLYQKSPNTKTLRSLITMLSPYIYHYPGFAMKQADKNDFFSEFYTSFYNKIEKVLLHYDSSKSSLSTYLSVVLRNHYCMLRKKQFTEAGKNHDTVPFEDSLYVPFEEVSPEEEPCQTFEARIHEVMDKDKQPMHYLIVKLYYIDFFTSEDFVLLQKYLGKPYSECLSKMDGLQEHVLERTQKKAHQEDKLHNIHRKILGLHKSMEGLNCEVLREDYLEKERQLHKRQREMIAFYKSMQVHPAHKVVADVLETESQKVANVLNHFKRKQKARWHDD